MKPLMMMRTRGFSGPAFAKHAGINKLTKSSGAFIDSAASGLQLELNSTNYAQTDTPVTLVGDFEIEIDFKVFGIGSRMSMVSSIDDFGIIIRTEDNGSISLFVGTNTSWVITTLTTDTKPSPNARHSVKVTRVGDVYSISVDGEVPATATSAPAIPFDISDVGGRISRDLDYYTGVIYSVRITDFDTLSNSISWKLDSGNTDREPSEELPEDDTKDLIYFNVIEDDWVPSDNLPPSLPPSTYVTHNGEIVTHNAEYITHG